MRAGARSSSVVKETPVSAGHAFSDWTAPLFTRKSRKLIATFDDRESRDTSSLVLNIAHKDRETIKVGGLFGCNGSSRWIGCLSDLSCRFRRAWFFDCAEVASCNESGTFVKRGAMTGNFPNLAEVRPSQREQMQPDFQLFFAHCAQLRMSEQHKDRVDRASETIVDWQHGHVSRTLANGQGDGFEIEERHQFALW